jgi:hypothetical protein
MLRYCKLKPKFCFRFQKHCKNAKVLFSYYRSLEQTKTFRTSKFFRKSLKKFLWEIFNFRRARQAEIKAGQQQANQRDERKTDRQDGMQTYYSAGQEQTRQKRGLVTERWEQTTDWQKDRQTYRRVNKRRHRKSKRQDGRQK